jgi:hypothetical protein
VTAVVLWGTVLLRAPLEKVPQSGAVLRSEEVPKMQEALLQVEVPQREQVVAVGRS